MGSFYATAFKDDFHCDFFGSLAELEFALESSKTRPDLLIADLRLPDGDFLEHVRNRGSLDIPFVVASGADDLSVLELSFRRGAADFFTKPIKLKEIRFKVEKLVARLSEIAAASCLRYADLVLDGYSQHLKGENPSRKVPLTQTEFKLLALFFDNPHRSLARHEIISALWKKQVCSGKVFDFHLSNSRGKIAELSLRIEFDREKGYRLRSMA